MHTFIYENYIFIYVKTIQVIKIYINETNNKNLDIAGIHSL